MLIISLYKNKEPSRKKVHVPPWKRITTCCLEQLPDNDDWADCKTCGVKIQIFHEHDCANFSAAFRVLKSPMPFPQPYQCPPSLPFTGDHPIVASVRCFLRRKNFRILNLSVSCIAVSGSPIQRGSPSFEKHCCKTLHHLLPVNFFFFFFAMIFFIYNVLPQLLQFIFSR